MARLCRSVESTIMQGQQRMQEEDCVIEYWILQQQHVRLGQNVQSFELKPVRKSFTKCTVSTSHRWADKCQNIIPIQLLMVGEQKDLKLYSGEKITNRDFRWKSNQNSIHVKKKNKRKRSASKQRSCMAYDICVWG